MVLLTLPSPRVTVLLALVSPHVMVLLTFPSLRVTVLLALLSPHVMVLLALLSLWVTVCRPHARRNNRMLFANE
eukprot:8764514-Pyramimonas_sp.AAC.1